MKKIISVALILVMILALGATAFAASGVPITKNPTDEVRSAGGTAWFVSGAYNYNRLSWTFISPDGTKYTVQEFKVRFPFVRIEGENSTNLTIRNLSTEMNGWGVFCSFYNNDDPTDTTVAFLYVNAYTPAPAPTYTAPTYTYSYSYPYYYYDDDEIVMRFEDGTLYTDYLDGSSLTEAMDGSSFYQRDDGYSLDVMPDGSYVEIQPDGSWESYDAATGNYYFGND